jgi:hypothetical protein
MKFHIRCQVLVIQLPDTRNLTPETYIAYLSAHMLRQPPQLLQSKVFEVAQGSNYEIRIVSGLQHPRPGESVC